MTRHYIVEVERTLTYRTKVVVAVEETKERLKSEAGRFPTTFKDDAEDAAWENGRALTGWEPHGAAEYNVVGSERVERPKGVDINV